MQCPIFPHSHKWHFWKTSYWTKIVCFEYSNNFCLGNTSHFREKWAKYDQKCILVFIKSTRYCISFQRNLKSLDAFSKNIQIQKFMKIRLVGVELSMRTDGRTDRHDKADSRFTQFRHVLKMDLFYLSRVKIWRGTYSLCSVMTATVIVRKGAPNTSNWKQTRYPKCCVLFGMLHGHG